MTDRNTPTIARELAEAGFTLAGFAIVGGDGLARFSLSGRGPGGAFVVSAPTEAAAYRVAIDQARRYLPGEPIERRRP